MFFWNPLHLIDGEAYWFLSFLTILAAASVATHGWRWVASRLHDQFVTKKLYMRDAALTAAQSPIIFYIWFLSGFKCVDLISDRFLTEGLDLGVLFAISAVLTVWWFLIRLKANVTTVLLAKSQAKEICLEPGKVLGLAKLASITVALVMIMMLMDVTGVSVNTLIAFGGISGLGIAFASQEIIANFFGGIMVHIIEPFAIGDLIQLPSSSVEGWVEEIGWYETRLRSRDKQPIYIPNSFFSKAYVVNSTRRTHRKIEEKISIRHKDLPKAPMIITDIRTYLLSLNGIDTRQKLLVNIASVGPYCIDINILALSTLVDEAKFLALRDLVLLKAVEIIISHGAEIATPIELVLPKSDR